MLSPIATYWCNASIWVYARCQKEFNTFNGLIAVKFLLPMNCSYNELFSFNVLDSDYVILCSFFLSVFLQTKVKQLCSNPTSFADSECMVSDEQTEDCLIIIQQGLKSFGDIFMKIGISPLLDFISPYGYF